MAKKLDDKDAAEQLGDGEFMEGRLRVVYDKFRETQSPKAAKMWGDVLSGKFVPPGATPLNPEHTRVIQLWEKVAKNSTFDEFNAFVVHRDLPPLKLSDKEMQLLQGGAWKPSEILGIASAVLGAAAAALA